MTQKGSLVYSTGRTIVLASPQKAYAGGRVGSGSAVTPRPFTRYPFIEGSRAESPKAGETSIQ